MDLALTSRGFFLSTLRLTRAAWKVYTQIMTRIASLAYQIVVVVVVVVVVVSAAAAVVIIIVVVVVQATSIIVTILN